MYIKSPLCIYIKKISNQRSKIWWDITNIFFSNVLVKVVYELKMLLNFDGVNYKRKNISVKKLLNGRWYDLLVIPATLNKIKLANRLMIKKKLLNGWWYDLLVILITLKKIKLANRLMIKKKLLNGRWYDLPVILITLKKITLANRLMIKKKLLNGRWYDLPVIPATLEKD